TRSEEGLLDRRLLDRSAARKRQVRRPQGPEADLRRPERRTRGVEQAADGPRLEGGALQDDRECSEREALARCDPRDELGGREQQADAEVGRGEVPRSERAQLGGQTATWSRLCRDQVA